MNEENWHQSTQQHIFWKKRLEFFRQENALLKYRLSGMVDYSGEKDFLQIAEYFQNELLIKDDTLSNLIKELKAITNEQNINEPSEAIIEKHNKLESFITQFEKEFLSLCNEFNQKMVKKSTH